MNFEQSFGIWRENLGGRGKFLAIFKRFHFGTEQLLDQSAMMDQSQKKVPEHPVLGCSLGLGVWGVNWLDGPRLKTMGQGGFRASRGPGFGQIENFSQ